MLASKFLAVLCAGLTLAASQPRVSRIDDFRASPVSAFAGSADIWRLRNGSLTVSTDGGANWTTIDSLAHITSFQIDENFPESRAFAVDGERGCIFQTVDQGRTWTQMPSDTSFWESPEDEADPRADLYFTLRTNPYAREDVIVTLSQCFREGHYGRCNASRRLFISTDGKQFRRAAGLSTPEGQLLDNRCQFFGAGAEPRIICGLRLTQALQGDGHHGVNFKLFYSDDHGESFTAFKEFENRTVMCSLANGDLSAVLTIDETENGDKRPANQLWSSQDGSHYEQVGSSVDHYMAVIRGIRYVSGRLVVNSISSEGKEIMLLSSSNGSLITPLVTFDSSSQSVSFIDTDVDHIAVVLHPWDMRSRDAYSIHGGDTQISFDNGLEWSRLQLRDPAHEFGCHLTQPANCFVNSVPVEPHIPSGVLGLSALVGVAVAANDTSSSVSKPLTFLTTDGGHSWQKLLDFPAVVAFGNYGKVILAAPTSNGPKTSKFYYSMDQGSSWSTGDFDQPLRVLWISLISSDSSSVAFVVTASHDRQELKYIIDFPEALGVSHSSQAAPGVAIDFGSDILSELTAGAQQVLERLSD
ncbi:LAQU0S13e03180g1_1 [Lachancea quebecensis]|uniref:LAQU0S13e03180g1_1 n=1 Tax=Lachancea quebecensis TaxID=1654605 RepID=A0A0P1KVS2_9SACH|nr:LAQU0S13e03180g1_1 [Lachancea quebecensis]